MIKFVNGGIYQVNLNGKSGAEFNGEHPSMIIQTPSEKDMYYIIPLTTYTKERWEKNKKKFACRIKSTGSIALIDKLQVRNSNFIKGKSISTNFNPPLLLIPTPDEIAAVTQKLCSYITKAVKNACVSYTEYYEAYRAFEKQWNDYLTGAISSGQLELNGFVEQNKEEDCLSVIIKPTAALNRLAIKDVKYIIENSCAYEIKVNFQRDELKELFVIHMNKKVDKT